MYRTLFPKIKIRASASCATFETIAPIVPSPIKLIRPDPRRRRSMYMDTADKKVPANEKRKIYENMVPVINACPSTLMATRTKKTWSGKISRASISGRFAMPIRMNGIGLGIMYSMVERKRQKAPRRARVFLVSLLCRLPANAVNFSWGIVSFYHYQNVVWKAGGKFPVAIQVARAHANFIIAGG